MSTENTIPVLNSIIADYLRETESGNLPNRDQQISLHPDLADELRLFFASHDAMKQTVQPVEKKRQPVDPAVDATLIPQDVNALDQTMAAEKLPEEDVILPRTVTSKADATAVGADVKYFGDYELLEEIARGGMGVVYKARQTSLNRIVALKMILTGQLAGEKDVQRFHMEAEAAANLDHPCIVPIFEIGEHGGQHYFSMGYIEGESLAQRTAHGPWAPRETAELVKKICDAMVQTQSGNRIVVNDCRNLTAGRFRYFSSIRFRGTAPGRTGKFQPAACRECCGRRAP